MATFKLRGEGSMKREARGLLSTNYIRFAKQAVNDFVLVPWPIKYQNAMVLSWGNGGLVARVVTRAAAQDYCKAENWVNPDGTAKDDAVIGIRWEGEASVGSNTVDAESQKALYQNVAPFENDGFVSFRFAMVQFANVKKVFFDCQGGQLLAEVGDRYMERMRSKAPRDDEPAQRVSAPRAAAAKQYRKEQVRQTHGNYQPKPVITGLDRLRSAGANAGSSAEDQELESQFLPPPKPQLTDWADQVEYDEQVNGEGDRPEVDEPATYAAVAAVKDLDGAVTTKRVNTGYTAYQPSTNATGPRKTVGELATPKQGFHPVKQSNSTGTPVVMRVRDDARQ